MFDWTIRFRPVLWEQALERVCGGKKTGMSGEFCRHARNWPAIRLGLEHNIIADRRHPAVSTAAVSSVAAGHRQQGLHRF